MVDHAENLGPESANFCLKMPEQSRLICIGMPHFCVCLLLPNAQKPKNQEPNES